MSEPFPWADVMRFGLGTMRLSSADFWKLTVPEVQAAASAFAQRGPDAPQRSSFEQLLKQFPDEKE